MKFTLKIGNNIHYEGSLIHCLNEAYGLSDFIILNHRMFNSTFHYENNSELSDYDDNRKYDYKFIAYCSHILTSKELDKFKKVLRK